MDLGIRCSQTLVFLYFVRLLQGRVQLDQPVEGFGDTGVTTPSGRRNQPNLLVPGWTRHQSQG